MAERKDDLKVFVYGTLKEGRPLDRKGLANLRTSVRAATIEGSIFTFKHASFPTIKLDGKGLVIGEVHTYPEKHLKDVIRTMDAIEGYNEHQPDRGLYNRHQVDATLKSGDVVTAWAYEYNGEVNPDLRIEKGLWEPGL
jgi:gamma-glutamylcyclotransferase (GGCT)/AIG2-like uncharacterized protein YtfP